jgi:hypothetical protein
VAGATSASSSAAEAARANRAGLFILGWGQEKCGQVLMNCGDCAFAWFF